MTPPMKSRTASETYAPHIPYHDHIRDASFSKNIEWHGLAAVCRKKDVPERAMDETE